MKQAGGRWKEMTGPNECKFILCTTELLYSLLQSWQERPTGRVKYWGGACSSTGISQGLGPGCLAWFLAWQQGSARCLSVPLWQLPSRYLLLRRGDSSASPPPSLPWCNARKAQVEKMRVAAPFLHQAARGEGGARRGKTIQPHAFLFLPAADGELPPAFPLEVYRKGELISFD